MGDDSGTPGFTCHAASPPGEWINDPNGLYFRDGRFRLLMQHSDDAPGYRRIGWGAASSIDLVKWRWDGVAIAPVGDASAYSGSVVTADPVTIFLTRNLVPGSPPQTQWRAREKDDGKLAVDPTALGPAGRNVRDPFVWHCAATGDWRMLLAEPCDWRDWADVPPSQLAAWASADQQAWRRVGSIGPWAPRGVMWEVPQLLDWGATQTLIVSCVDRRDDGAACTVLAWSGRFTGATFEPAGAAQPVDLGPDFYAACLNTADGWPHADRVVVGWAASWATARNVAWPGERRGGPIALPRIVTQRGDRLALSPIAAARDHSARTARWAPGTRYQLNVAGSDATFVLNVATNGTLSASRDATDVALHWKLRDPPTLTEAATITVFADAGLIEIFVEPVGLVLTVVVPGGTVQGDPR